jgi:hypothetical protein
MKLSYLKSPISVTASSINLIESRDSRLSIVTGYGTLQLRCQNSSPGRDVIHSTIEKRRWAHWNVDSRKDRYFIHSE